MVKNSTDLALNCIAKYVTVDKLLESQGLLFSSSNVIGLHLQGNVKRIK